MSSSSTLLLILLLSLGTCFGVKVALVLPGSTNDEGWNYEINLGRLQLLAQVPATQTIVAENVSVAACESVVTNFISQGYQLIWLADINFRTCVLDMAHAHPNTFFVQHWFNELDPTLPNLSVEFHADTMGQARYIAGVFAGRSTTNNKIGWMSVQSPNTVHFANLFYNGITAYNPSATLHVSWVDNFDDPINEPLVVHNWVNNGVELFHTQQNSINPERLMIELGGRAIGTSSDMRVFLGNNVLTSVLINWATAMIHFVDKIAANQWTSEVFILPLNPSGISLAAASPLAPIDAKIIADVEMSLIQSGVKSEYCGPIIARTYHKYCLVGADQQLLFNSLLPGIVVDNYKN